MKIRPIREEDYEKVVGWYADVSWPTPAVDGSLPKNGFVAEVEGTGEIAGCLWVSLDGSSSAELKWPATNPYLDPRAQASAVEHLIRYVQKMAPNLKPEVRLLLLYTRSPALAQAMENCGFRKKEKIIQCSWVLPHEG